MTLRRVGLIGLCVAIAGCVVAQRRPGPPPPPPGPGMRPDLLRKLIESQARLRYAGTRVVELGAGPMRRAHREIVLRAGPLMRTEFPPGSEAAGQIIVENGQVRRHFFPDLDEIRIMPARREEALERLNGLFRQVQERRAQLRTRPGGQVAGYRTLLLEFLDPRENPIQRLWIEPEHGMVLKRELFDPAGGRIGYFEFTEVNFNPLIREGDFEINRRGAKIVTLDQYLERLARRLSLRPIRVPPNSGFQLFQVRSLKLAGVDAIEMSFEGPAASFSVFLVRGEVDAARLQNALDPSMSCRVWRDGDQTVALIGHAPREAWERIARMIQSQMRD